MHESIVACRACGGGNLGVVLDLGDLPLADALLPEDALGRPEPRYPLTVLRCEACSLLQLRETVSPETLFGADYPYYSSFSPALLDHAESSAEALIAARSLGGGSRVVEVASNDGYLLQFFARRGVQILGIDPAPGPAEAAWAKGIPTLCTFFTQELATKLRGEGLQADVVIANNVLAHVPDLNGFVAGIRTILAEGGVAVIEVPYVRDLIDRCEFDTIYHEHLCYFSVTPLVALFGRHGLCVEHVEHHWIHGGSLRLYVEASAGSADSVESLLAEERAAGLDEPGYYRDFSARVRRLSGDLRALLHELKAAGRRVVGYGAAAKGATLLNYTGIGPDVLDFVVDRNIHKQGRYMPGVRLPIRDPAALLEEQPDHVLMLAWNFKDEILEQQEEYRRRGGRFIIPVPEPVIV